MASVRYIIQHVHIYNKLKEFFYSSVTKIVPSVTWLRKSMIQYGIRRKMGCHVQNESCDKCVNVAITKSNVKVEHLWDCLSFALFAQN